LRVQRLARWRYSWPVNRADQLKASPPMFDNPVMDRFTRVHPAVPVLLFVPAIAVLFITGAGRVGALEAVGLALAGYVFWTLTEYWLHRVVFHFEPEGGIGQRLHWMIHGVHHDHPNDPLRLVMPPSASVPLALLFLSLFWAVLGYDAALAFGGGFLGGYLAYDMLHYHVHHHTPRTAVGKRLRELHMRHHFQDDDRGFGVSAPYWDHVFGTAPERKGNRALRDISETG
jgi:dihydroceramide fatty acyl 2-hydroxylase